MHPLEDKRIDWDFLRRYGFEDAAFRAAAEAITRGTLTEASSIIPREALAPLPPNEVAAVDPGQTAPYAKLGREALSKGEVAVMVVNGGMATRFGGVVKGVVEVFDGETFISLKAMDIRRAREHYKAPLPFVLMNSFATNKSTLEHVEARRGFNLPAGEVLHFEQSVSLRMNPDGSLFIGNDDKPSYHAPGHGDFFKCIRRSGVLAKLRERGVKTLMFSNVDNLGATVDPTIVGHHLASGKDMSAELTEKRRTASGEWDKGGAPAKVNGTTQIVEGFRFPKDFQQDQLPDFSTNNFLFRIEAIDRDIPLDRHVVRKKVDDRPALQLEMITCEASGTKDATGKPVLSLNLMRVPRDGPSGRFFPIKEPQDLDQLRDTIRTRLYEGWKAREGA